MFACLCLWGQLKLYPFQRISYLDTSPSSSGKAGKKPVRGNSRAVWRSKIYKHTPHAYINVSGLPWSLLILSPAYPYWIQASECAIWCATQLLGRMSGRVVGTTMREDIRPKVERICKIVPDVVLRAGCRSYLSGYYHLSAGATGASQMMVQRVFLTRWWVLATGSRRTQVDSIIQGDIGVLLRAHISRFGIRGIHGDAHGLRRYAAQYPAERCFGKCLTNWK